MSISCTIPKWDPAFWWGPMFTHSFSQNYLVLLKMAPKSKNYYPNMRYNPWQKATFYCLQQVKNITLVKIVVSWVKNGNRKQDPQCGALSMHLSRRCIMESEAFPQSYKRTCNDIDIYIYMHIYIYANIYIIYIYICKYMNIHIYKYTMICTCIRHTSFVHGILETAWNNI